MVKKKVSKKNTDKKSKERVLSEVQMLKLDNKNKDLMIKQLEILVVQLKQKIKSYEFENELIKKNSELSKGKESVKSYNNELKKEFNIKTETWGYDPLTGEIKDE